MSKAGTTGGAATVVRNAGAAPRDAGESRGNGSIEGGAGSDAGLKAASAGFLKGRNKSAAAPTAPAAPSQPAAQTGDLETDVAAGAAPEPGDERDPTDLAYEPDEIDEPEAGADATAEDAAEGQPAEPAQGTEALDAFAKTFGLKAATEQHQDAILSDAQAFLAQRGQGGQQATQPDAARSPAAAGNPPGPQATPPASPKSEAAPAPSGNGSADLQLLSDEQIASAAEYGPGVESIAKSHNTLVKELNESRKQVAALAPLAQQLPAVMAAIEWMQVQPVVQSFADEMVKAGLPPIPPEQLRDFAADAAGYLDHKTRQGVQFTPKQAMHAMYLARTGSKVQEQASQAREEGRREVVNGLEKRQRRFDVAGGPGAIPSGGKAPDDDAALLQHARAWRRQNNVR